MRGLAHQLAAAIGGVSLVAALAPAAAHAQYSVTIAARACPSYEAITANLARNDIQESLRDLGPDTLYRPGQPIDPQLEAAGQPLCEPLPDWRFTLGRGFRSRAVTGTWGSLSIVTDPFASDPPLETQGSIPLLDSAGRPTGRTIAGAVRAELSATQVSLAARHSLWLQGGTPADPVLDQRYPRQYGFGALRCAIDNLNGDNVEYVAFPEGAQHVFCFAYYVQPPPTSGTIVVRKEVEGAPDLPAHDFQFGGTLSYDPQGAFELAAAPGRPASQTFFRAGGQTWRIQELVEPGWELAGLSCVSQTGASSAPIAAGSPIVDVALAAGDTVTCTYGNRLQPPASGLTLGKATLGGTGATAFDITGPALAASTRIETSRPGAPAYERLPSVPPGSYDVRESPVEQPGGRWVRRQVRCGGRILSEPTEPLRLTVEPGAGVVCVYVNEFVPSGSIRVRKVMRGGTGTTGFTIRPLDADPPVVYSQLAEVGREGVPVLAVGDPTGRLPLGTYDIQETTPSGRGRWLLESVVCNGVPVGSAQGRIRVRLTADEPDLTCTFSDRRVRDAEPPGRGPDPGPGGGVRGSSDPSPHTNVSVVKRVRPPQIAHGQPARYRVIVRNRSRFAARDVVVEELQPPSQRAVAIDAPRGVRCRGRRPLRCLIGDLGPGRRVVLRATHVTALLGRVVNRVAVHTATPETRLRDNRSRAVLQVVRQRPAACGASRPLARAAC